MREPHKRGKRSKDDDNKDEHTRIDWKTEFIHREGIHRSTERHGVGYDDAIYSTKNKERHHQRGQHHNDVALGVCHLVAAEEPYHNQRGDGQ